MSTILKALQRLEDEKQPTPELTLDEQIAMASPPARRASRGPLLLAAGGAAAMVVAAGAIYFWFGSDAVTEVEAPVVAALPSATNAAPARPTVPTVSIPSDSPQVPRARPAVAGSRTRSAPPPSPTPSRESTPVEVVQRLSPPPPIAAQPSPPSAAREAAVRGGSSASTDSNVTQPVVASAKRSKRPTSPTRPGAGRKARPTGAADATRGTRPASARSVRNGSSTSQRELARLTDRAQPIRVAAASPPAAKPPPAAEPAGTQKPASATASAANRKPASGSGVEPDHKVVLRAQLPEVKVRSTIWHPQAGRRIAMVEVDSGEVLELNEGDAVGPLVVEAIKPGGVYFAHDGISVLHKIGR